MSLHVAKRNASNNLKNDIFSLVSSINQTKSFGEKGETVFLKPNFNTADPYPASSDYHFLKAVIEIVLDQRAGRVILGDACTFSQNTERVLKDLNIYELEKIDKRVEVQNLDMHKRIKKDIANGKYLKCVYLPEVLDQIDKLIYLPCLKTHSIAKFTGSLKLSIGLMSKRQKLSFHTGNLHGKIAELNTAIHPDLVIMDARKCFINKGPAHGDIRNPNLLLASSKRSSIDIEGVRIIKSFKGNSLADTEPLEIEHIRIAQELGL